MTRWEQVTGAPAPAPALLHEGGNPRPAPVFVEWLMGLPAGWVTDTRHMLTPNQQLQALGNGVLPRQASISLQTAAGLLFMEGAENKGIVFNSESHP